MRILQQNYSKSELPARDARDAVRIGFKRSRLTLQLAERLKSLVASSGTEKARYNVAKLQRCGSLANIWTANDMHNSDGECFDGVGHLWACSLPYCANCQALKSGRHRRRIRATLATLKPRVGLSWQFVTLTSPSVPASALLAIEVYQKAWALLRKRKLFVESVRAGYRGIEFTTNKTTGLVHVHLHALLLSKFLRPSDVRAQWQDCITKAWQSFGVSLRFPASGAVIKIVHELTAKNSGSLDNAILETAKYCADGAAWASLSDNELIEIANLDRFPRLFEVVGEARKFGRDIILDNPDLSDGEILPKLKTTKPKSNRELSTLNLRVNVNRTYRKAQLIKRFPVAKFKTLDGRDFLPSEPKFTGTLTLVKKPKEHKPMKLPAILLDETSDINRLTDELGHIPSQLKDAARRNDVTALTALSDRRSHLPELIQKAKMKDFASRLSVARSRVAAFDIELQAANREAGTKGRDAETKIPLLEQEIERLRSEWAQVRHDVESLQFEARQAHAELERIQAERVDLLLAQFN
jgi:hypothetical protein